ncbi:MAG: PAS domain S-box protein [Bacteroidota bacterium]
MRLPDFTDMPNGQAQFCALYTHAQAGIALIGAEGKVLGANQAFCQTVGLTDRQVRSLSMKALMTAGRPEEHPEPFRNAEERMIFDHRTKTRWSHAPGKAVELGMLFTEVHFDFDPRISYLAVIMESRSVPHGEEFNKYATAAMHYNHELED